MQQSPRPSGNGSSNSSAPPQHSNTTHGATNQSAAASSGSAASASASASTSAASASAAAAAAAAQAQAHARARHTALNSLSARRKRLARQDVADKKQACKPHLQQPFLNEKDFFDRLHVFHVFDSVMPDREKSVRYRSEMADHAAVLASKIADLGERYFEYVAKTEGSTAIQARHAAKPTAAGDKRTAPADDKAAADDGGGTEAASKRAKTADSNAPASAALPAHVSPGSSVQQLLSSRVRFDAEFRAHVSTLQRIESEARQRQEAKHAKEQADMMERYRQLHASQAAAAGAGSAHGGPLSHPHTLAPGFTNNNAPTAAGANYAHYAGTKHGMQQQQQQPAPHSAQRQPSPMHGQQPHPPPQQSPSQHRFPQPHMSPSHSQAHSAHAMAMQPPQPSPTHTHARLTLPPSTGSFDPLSASYNPYQ